MKAGVAKEKSVGRLLGIHVRVVSGSKKCPILWNGVTLFLSSVFLTKLCNVIL